MMLLFFCGHGSAKQHTTCVATHVVGLRAFRKRPRSAIEYAATTVTYGSALDGSRSAEIQRQQTSSSDGEDATLQPSTANVADETEDVLRRYAGANA